MSEEVRQAIETVLECDEDAILQGRYGLLDCVDNAGAHFQSEMLSRALLTLRAAMKLSKDQP